MKDILCRHGLGTNAALGEGHILWDVRIEMMANHRHIEMFVKSVDGVRVGGIGGGRKTVHFAGHPNDVRGMSAACAFGVISVDRAPVDASSVSSESRSRSTCLYGSGLENQARRRPTDNNR